MKKSRQSKENTEPKTSTYIEDENRKQDKCHPLCGTLVKYDFDLFKWDKHNVKKTGEEVREGFILAVYNDLVEIGYPSNPNTIITTKDKIHDISSEF